MKITLGPLLELSCKKAYRTMNSTYILHSCRTYPNSHISTMAPMLYQKLYLRFKTT